MSEILDCGHSYMITGPNGRVYRRNRAHLKPICYDGSSFQNHTTAEKDEKPKVDSFQDPKKDGKKVKTMSFQTDTADVMARAMIFDKQSDHPSHPSSCQHYSPRSPSYSPPSSVPSRESSVEPNTEEATPEGRIRHKSEPAFIRPKDIDRRLTTGLSALLQETSPLAPYKKERSAKGQGQGSLQQHVLNCFYASVSEFSARTKKLTHFKTPTEIDSFQDPKSAAEIDSFQDPESVWHYSIN